MTPQAVAADYRQNIISTFDIDKPERLNILYRRYGNQKAEYFRLLDSMGFRLPVSQDTYEHDEENWIRETFHSRDAEVAPGPGNNILITLDPTDLDASNRFYPRLLETVMFPNEVTGQIIDIDTTTPTAPVLTIRPNDSGDDIGAIAAGTELILISGASSEGAGQPKGAVSGVLHYENDLQIIKETLTVTGSEATNQKWITKISDPNGGNIPTYYIKGQRDMDHRMQFKIGGAMLFQKRTDNNIQDAANDNEIVKTTEGCVPYIRNNGNILPYTPGSYSIQKFNEMGKILDANNTTHNVCMLNGIDLDYDIEDTIVDYMKDTNIQYAREVIVRDVFGNDNGLAISVDFKTLRKGHFNFMLKNMPIFSDAKSFGAAGYDHAGMGIVMPVGKKKDKKSLKDLPTFGMRFKKLGPYSRFMEVWDVSGAGTGQKVTEFDNMNFYQRCHVGAHHMAGNQMILIDPS